MNLVDLADRLAAKDTSLTKAQAKGLAEEVFTAIRESAVSGDEVSIPGFGKFKVQDKPARQGRNPATGATIEIAATKKLAFQPAKALKDALAK